MASALGSILAIIAPKKSAKSGGTSATPTYNPQQADRVLTVPVYQEHLNDIFDSRQAQDSRELLRELFRTDPDVSAVVFSYLTLANTDMSLIVRDIEGEIDRDQTKEINKLVQRITLPTDYTLGFQLKRGLKTLCEELRYMFLLRGAVGIELVLDKQLAPSELRNVDMSTVQWYEKTPGQYKPVQKVVGSDKETSLDVPTFFVNYFRRDPTSVYSWSPFISSINTIAARQQVINDLYRIMKKTGFPRMDIKVLEEVLTKSMPIQIKNDPAKVKTWLETRIGEVRVAFEGLRSDQAVVHMDSVEVTMMNDKSPGAGININSVIETLNAQNQAALKTMATVIGRGTSGVNTGSVEARIASMNADELNEPLAEILSNAFSFLLHQTGYQGFVEVEFEKAELRPDLELEPQLMLRASRLRQDLSDGLITDDEFHLQMYRRMRPDSVPELSGTGFMSPTKVAVDETTVSSNSDPLGRGLTGEGAKAAKSNGVAPK